MNKEFIGAEYIDVYTENTFERVYHHTIDVVTHFEMCNDIYIGYRHFKGLRLSRNDGPAIETSNGSYEWYINGVHHRIGGPAIYEANSDESHWLQNGLYHNENGPAYTSPTLSEWLISDKTHRLDGPAKIFVDFVQWYVGNQDITDQVCKWIEQNNIPDWKEWTNQEKVLFKLKFG